MSLLRTKKEGLDLVAEVRPNGKAERDEMEMHQRDGDAVYVAARFIGSFDAEGKPTELMAISLTTRNASGSSSSSSRRRRWKASARSPAASRTTLTTSSQSSSATPRGSRKRTAHPEQRTTRSASSAKRSSAARRWSSNSSLQRARPRRNSRRSISTRSSRDGQHARRDFSEDDQLRAPSPAATCRGKSRPQPDSSGAAQPLRQRPRRDARRRHDHAREHGTISGAQLGEYFTGVTADNYAACA